MRLLVSARTLSLIVLGTAFTSLQSIYNVTIKPVNTLSRLLSAVAAEKMMPSCYVKYSIFQVSLWPLAAVND